MSKTEVRKEDVRTPIPGAMAKSMLTGRKRHKATRVRYAVANEDGSFSFSFTSTKPGSESGKSYTRNCTKYVYEKVYGRHPGNDMNRTPAGGYSQMADRTFFVYENLETGVVDALSVGPGHFFNSKQNAPVVLKDIRVLDTIFHPESGSFEVAFIRGPENDWQLPSMPGDLKSVEFDRLVQSLDKVDELYPGQQITPDLVVSTVAGNRVTFTR